MNRVHVHVYNVKQDSLMNRNDELSSTLFSMKKNCQFSLNSKTMNKMNIENDLFATKILKVSLFMRILILLSKQRSCRQKNLYLRYKQKLFMYDSIQDYSRFKSNTRNSKKRFVSLSKKQKKLFQKNRLKKSF
jgi:hypothetical protein